MPGRTVITYTCMHPQYNRNRTMKLIMDSAHIHGALVSTAVPLWLTPMLYLQFPVQVRRYFVCATAVLVLFKSMRFGVIMHLFMRALTAVSSLLR